VGVVRRWKFPKCQMLFDPTKGCSMDSILGNEMINTEQRRMLLTLLIEY
jgi:hypothetical protein